MKPLKTMRDEEAEEFADDLCNNHFVGTYIGNMESYKLGFDRAFELVLERLRSDECNDAMARGFHYARPSSTADWLEQQFNGEQPDTKQGEEEDDPLCRDCNGSGEGMYQGIHGFNKCLKCNGEGVNK